MCKNPTCLRRDPFPTKASLHNHIGHSLRCEQWAQAEIQRRFNQDSLAARRSRANEEERISRGDGHRETSGSFVMLDFAAEAVIADPRECQSFGFVNFANCPTSVSSGLASPGQ
jgi:hypothetical protein